MRPFHIADFLPAIRWWVMLAVLTAPGLAPAETWKVAAGAQNATKDRQAFAFLPNELWIHTGDALAWQVESDEMHTITFLKPAAVRPTFQTGCPGTTPNGSPFDGTACVNSGTLVSGQSYRVNFPTHGNFKLACLVHANMTGTIHVLDFPATLPHDQNFYDAEAVQRRRKLFDLSIAIFNPILFRDDDSQLREARLAPMGITTSKEVVAGLGGIVATPGGTDTVAIMRFLQPVTYVHVGDTVEWRNFDPVTPHTITFGTEPPNPNPPSSNITADPDGAEHATVDAATDSVNSGFIVAAPQDRIGLAQSPPGVTRFRVTFTKPGIFNYICALHDTLGMVGAVVVLP
ncbi:MAG: cupredoxin domain-containing protein [Bryobacteraceae bacterium]